MSKHTPGPLTLSNPKLPLPITGRDILSPCGIVGFVYGRDGDDDIASVAMFISAPELTACLKAMVDECSRWPGGSASGQTIDRALTLLERIGKR